MFCYQCEQRARGTGCTTFGVCGKDPETSDLQDLLLRKVKKISRYAKRARVLGVKDKEIDIFVVEALFSTITNVNFDPKRLQGMVDQAEILKDKSKALYVDACVKAHIIPDKLTDIKDFVDESQDIVGLRNLILLGVKGLAAYVYHALMLGEENDEIYSRIHETLDFVTKEGLSIEELLGMALKCGELNLMAMELLDKANTGTYGNPVPTSVRVTPIKGKAILVSGHDLKDLEELLKQTEGKDINIYTHGEMLPAHGYPKLKKYPHLIGNYGGAWQDQHKDFDAFPGAILMTTNCIQKPKATYENRIFTCGPVAWPGVIHIKDYDFTPVIEAALNEQGFIKDEVEKEIMVGFGHNAVLGVADKVINAVKSGELRHIFLIGGCDGAKSGRNYYTDLANMVPDDCIILTLACGKYRFNKLDFGTLGELPRLLDIGQCNDAYSAIKIAVALADAFNTDVNGLPLSIVLSWYEQKAVSILLTLLYLDIKNIRLGPSMPAFVTPQVYEILKEEFNLLPITTPEDDLKALLG